MDDKTDKIDKLVLPLKKSLDDLDRLMLSIEFYGGKPVRPKYSSYQVVRQLNNATDLLKVA